MAVIGSIAASLYATRLGATIPPVLPLGAALAAKGSVGGALIAAQGLGRAGLTSASHGLYLAAIGAFLHSFAWSLRVAGAVAFGGAVMAAALLPSRPGLSQPSTTIVGDGHDALASLDAALDGEASQSEPDGLILVPEPVDPAGADQMM